MASGCTIKIEDYGATHDLRQNKALGRQPVSSLKFTVNDDGSTQEMKSPT